MRNRRSRSFIVVLRAHLKKTIEWLLCGILWITISAIIFQSYPYQTDVIIKWFAILLGAIPIIVGLRKPAPSPLDTLEKIKLRWLAVYALAVCPLAIPLSVLALGPTDSGQLSESMIVISAPYFALTCNFLSVANSVLVRASRLRVSERKTRLIAAANRTDDGALLVGASAVLLFSYGLLARYSLIPLASSFSLLFMRLVLILLILSLFTLGVFRACKVSEWYLI